MNETTALAPYDGSAEGGHEARVTYRHELARKHIAAGKGNYAILSVDPETTSPLSNYDERTLFRGDSDDLGVLRTLSERYFNFRPALFKFHLRPGRTLADLLPWRRPATHADLEDEDVEQKFPDDINIRAAIEALNLVIVENQVRHIRLKRWYQFLASAVVVVFAVIWFFFGHLLSAVILQSLSPELNTPAAGWGLWLFFTIAFLAGIARSAQAVLKRELHDTTDLFKAANEASCSRLVSVMTRFNGDIRARFTKLLSSIKDTAEVWELVKSETWPDKAGDVFKVAMWEGKRVESIEKFWQTQFERLRLFELISDYVGNLSSMAIAIAISIVLGLALLIGVAFDQSLLEAMARAACLLVPALFAIWHFGAISRRPGLSFGMADIVDEFKDRWQHFSTLRYYENLAGQFKWGMDAKRTNIVARTRI